MQKRINYFPHPQWTGQAISFQKKLASGLVDDCQQSPPLKEQQVPLLIWLPAYLKIKEFQKLREA